MSRGGGSVGKVGDVGNVGQGVVVKRSRRRDGGRFGGSL